MTSKKIWFKPNKSDCALIGASLLVGFFVVWCLWVTVLKDFSIFGWIEKRQGFWAFMQAMAAVITLVSTVITWRWQVKQQQKFNDDRLEEKEQLDLYKKHQFRKFVKNNNDIFIWIKWFTGDVKDFINKEKLESISNHQVITRLKHYVSIYNKYNKELSKINEIASQLSNQFDSNHYFFDVDNLFFEFRNFSMFFFWYKSDESDVVDILNNYQGEDQEFNNDLIRARKYYDLYSTQMEHSSNYINRISEYVDKIYENMK